MRVRGGCLGLMRRKKITREDVIRRLGELAYGRSNDAVRLVFLEPGEAQAIDGLDLSLLAEVRRSEKGLVEVKLCDRVRALELLAGLLEEKEAQGSEAGRFFAALEQAAAPPEQRAPAPKDGGGA